MKKLGGKIFFVLLVIAMVALASCDPSKKWEKAEREQIQNYLSSIGDTIYDLKPSGLYYLSILEGTGLMPVTNDTVSIRYTIKLVSGTLFQTNVGQTSPFKFIVGSYNIIRGINEGVTYMKMGGKAKLLTPSNLAYGPQGLTDAYGYNILPGYTPLVWDIELVDVRPGPVK